MTMPPDDTAAEQPTAIEARAASLAESGDVLARCYLNERALRLAAEARVRELERELSSLKMDAMVRDEY